MVSIALFKYGGTVKVEGEVVLMMMESEMVAPFSERVCAFFLGL